MRYALGSLGCLVAANPYDIDLHGQSIRVVRSSSLMLMMDSMTSTTSTASPISISSFKAPTLRQLFSTRSICLHTTAALPGL